MDNEKSVLDLEILEDLKDLADDGEILPMALYETFFRTSEERLELMKKNLEIKDYSEMRNLAHSLKGSSYNLAASRMGSLAAEMEQTAESQNADQYALQLNQLRVEYQRVKDEISKIANPS